MASTVLLAVAETTEAQQSLAQQLAQARSLLNGGQVGQAETKLRVLAKQHSDKPAPH